MSGNSHDRRKYRRLADQLRPFLFDLNKRKPIDAWLTCATAAIGIGQVWSPRTPQSVIAALSLMFVLALHPAWNFWWIEGAPWRRITAVAVLLGGLGYFGYKIWPTYYFPWLSTNGTLVENGKTIGMMMRFIIRSQHRIRSGSKLPNNPLQSVRLSVVTPILRSDSEGWNECYLATIPNLPIWSNRDLTLGNLGILYLRNDSTLLKVTASDAKGDWDMIAVLRVVNGKLETREQLSGRMFESNSEVHIDEATDGFPRDERAIPLKWDRRLFLRYAVPSVTRGGVSGTCQALSLRS